MARHGLVLPKEVIYISRDFAQGLHTAENLISIRSPKEEKMRLFGFEMDLTQDVCLIKDDEDDGGRECTVTHVSVRSDSMYAVEDKAANAIVKAAVEANGEGIVVNCHYGLVRSFTVATWIRDRLDYVISKMHWAEPEQRCTKDSGLYRALDEAFKRNYPQLVKEQA